MKKSAFAAVAIFALLGLGQAAQAGAPGPAPIQTARNPGDQPGMLDPDNLAKPRPKARVYRGARITLSATRELAVHADGVVVGNLPQTFTIRPKALAVFAPRAR